MLHVGIIKRDEAAASENNISEDDKFKEGLCTE